jgi:plasmid stabilization system protein ParE
VSGIIKWLPDALADVRRLHEFVKAQHPEAAARVAKTILDGADLLSRSPDLGHPMDDGTGLREFFISFGAGAYVIRYVNDTDFTPVIIRVWHSREQRTSHG